jgi:hypothetical protein
MPGSLIAPGTESGSLIAPEIYSRLGPPMAPGVSTAAGSPMASVRVISVGSSMTPTSVVGATGSPMAPAPKVTQSTGSGSAMPPDTSATTGSGSPMAPLSGGASERVRLPGDLSGHSYNIFDVGRVEHASKLAPCVRR